MAAFVCVATVIGLWLIVTTGLGYHLLPPSSRSSALTCSLVFFNNLNLFIAFCETTLGSHIGLIKSDYRDLRERYKGKEWDACVAFLLMPLAASHIFDGRIWCKMWSTYALYDPSYQNHEAFGFFIDLGNGYSTVIPTLLMNAGMIWPERASHLWVGCVGLAMYWQIMYGTIIYLLSFIFNRRYEGKNLLGVAAFVGISNSLWFFFPILGIYACVCVLRDGDLSVFES